MKKLKDILKNILSEAAPRMKGKDSAQLEVEKANTILSGLENMMKAHDSSRYSNMRNEFRAVMRAIDKLDGKLRYHPELFGIGEDILNEEQEFGKIAELCGLSCKGKKWVGKKVGLSSKQMSGYTPGGQSLNEVKPFIDKQLLNKWRYVPGSGSPKGKLQYLATNDRRYPTELVVYNPERDVFHFIYSQQGKWSQGNTTQETIPANKLSSTHWIWPYLKDWKAGKGEYANLGEGKVTESVLRGQLAGDSALDMANHLRQYGVKKILKQPNDSVTYLQLTNKSKGTKVVAMLKKMFGIKAQIDNHMYSPTPAVKFDNDQIAESKLTEGKYDHMVGKAFKLNVQPKKEYQIQSIEDNRFVHAIDNRQNKSMFDIRKVVKDNPGIDKKPKVKRKVRIDKGTGDPHLISKREYAKILMGAMKDATSMGDEEHTHDIAQSMIYDLGILARLVKDHPGKNSKQLTQQLQWDLEAAA